MTLQFFLPEMRNQLNDVRIIHRWPQRSTRWQIFVVLQVCGRNSSQRLSEQKRISNLFETNVDKDYLLLIQCYYRRKPKLN